MKFTPCRGLNALRQAVYSVIGCGLIIISVGSVFGGIVVYQNTYAAQYVGIYRLKQIILSGAPNRCDSLVIGGMLDGNNNMLLNKFDASTVRRFYDSVDKPKDYFINMKKALGWNFVDYARNVQEYIEKSSKKDSSDNRWNAIQTANFIIYYMPALNDSIIINTLGNYLETEFIDIKSCLAIDDNDSGDNWKPRLIKSFYPDSSESFIIPNNFELTEGKIQIILFPNQDRVNNDFPVNVNRETGGKCLFQLYQNKNGQGYLPDLPFLNLRVEMVFGGYVSFPFIVQELARALRCIYYCTYDFKGLYQDEGIDGCLFEDPWDSRGGTQSLLTYRPDFMGPLFYNEIFEVAISYYAMFSSGPLYHCGMIPPLGDLINQKIKHDSRIISDGARGYVDFGRLDWIGSKLELSPPPDQKIAETVFALADFLSYLRDDYSPDKLGLFLSHGCADDFSSFKSTFGESLREAELKWNQMIIGH